MIAPAMVVLQIFLLLFVVGLIHRYQHKTGTGYLIVFLTAVMVIVQWLSDVGSITFFQGFPIFISSIVFFPSILFGLFLIFVFDGATETRKLFYGLLTGEALYAFSVIALSLTGIFPSYFQLNTGWFQNHIFSTLAVVADFYFITLMWSYMSKNSSFLIAKIAFVFLGVNLLDTTIFVVGAFWGNPAMINILRTDYIVRIVLSLLLIPTAYVYIQLERKIRGFQIETRYPWSILATHKESTEVLKEANKKIDDLERTKARLEEMSIVADKTISGVTIANAKGEITWINESFSKNTGYDLSDVVGHRRQEILTGKDTDQKDTNRFVDGMKEKKPFFVEILNYKKNGDPIWLHIEVTPIIENDQVIKFIAVESDITKLKQITVKYEETNRYLSEMNEAMIGRELKMSELKKEIEEYKQMLQQKAK